MYAVFVTTQGQVGIDRAYDAATMAILEKTLTFLPPLFDPAQLDREDLKKVDYIFSTWGMFTLTEEQIAQVFPNLKAVFYGAGSVQGFARPFLNRGVRIFSAWGANAVPVVEYTVSQVLLANKGYYQSMQLYKRGEHGAARAYSEKFPGNYGGYVGVIGAGMIGKMVVKELAARNLKVLVADPFLSEEIIATLGGQKAELAEVFEKCQTVTNHTANNEQTKGMLNYSLFSRMKNNATFINTGRGAQVVEADLVRALTEQPERTAILDVTFPEPVEKGHPFYEMDNVFLTPHLAGSVADEIARMGMYMAKSYEQVNAGEPADWEVSLKMLETMA